jgi:hypothetical protein
MTREVSELLEKALSLPPEARAALAGSLLEASTTTLTPTPKRNGTSKSRDEFRNWTPVR